MTPRTFFIVVLRILGLLSLRSLLDAVPQLFTNMVFLLTSRYDYTGGIGMLFVSLLIVGLFITISYILIFRANYLVTSFKLDSDIESPLPFNISRDSILRIAIIVIGFLILFFEIPVFCTQVYTLMQRRNIVFLQNGSPDWSPVIFSGAKILIGLLIIGERKRILNLLENRPLVPVEEDGQKDS